MTIHRYLQFAVLAQGALSARSTQKLGKHFHSSSKICKDILALDFDGVICKSDGESTHSAVLAAKNHWSDITSLLKDETRFQDVKGVLSEVRPLIETGFELVLLARYITEEFNNENSNKRPNIASNIFNQWSPLFCDKLLSKYHSDKKDLVEAFGTTRDDIMKNDIRYWAGLNKIYHPINQLLHSDLIKSIQSELYIVTTKEERFVKAILEHNKLSNVIKDGLSNTKPRTNLPEDNLIYSHIYDLKNIYGKKYHVLSALNDPNLAITKYTVDTIHFVEDRLETLLTIDKLQQNEVNNTLKLHNVKLYLVDWGYNTEREREIVRQHPRIHLLNYVDFQELVGTIAKKNQIL